MIYSHPSSSSLSHCRLVLAALALLCVVPGLQAEETVSPETAAADKKAVDDFSAALGKYMAKQIQDMGVDGDVAVASIKEALAAGTPVKVPGRAEMMAMQTAFNAARNRPMDAISKKIIAETDITSSGTAWKETQKLPASVHDEFYAAFLKQEGVKKTASGLAYKVIKAGEADGAKPTASDKVSVHYVGRHTSGDIFDSSISRNEIATFPLNGVIKGWTEGLQLMPIGATYRFVIPAELAYGPLQEGSGRPTGILIFDVSLLRIN